jgi:hypothetical protein
MLPDEVSGEIREGGGHCVKPHKDWVDCSTNANEAHAGIAQGYD